MTPETQDLLENLSREQLCKIMREAQKKHNIKKDLVPGEWEEISEIVLTISDVCEDYDLRFDPESGGLVENERLEIYDSPVQVILMAPPVMCDADKECFQEMQKIGAFDKAHDVLVCDDRSKLVDFCEDNEFKAVIVYNKGLHFGFSPFDISPEAHAELIKREEAIASDEWENGFAYDSDKRDESIERWYAERDKDNVEYREEVYGTIGDVLMEGLDPYSP